MNNYKVYQIGRVNPLIALLIFFAIMFGLFWLARGIYSLLSMAFPFIIIATAIINHRVLIGYFRWIVQTLQTNPVAGIIAIVFTIIAHPLVGAYLLFRAISERKEDKEKVSSVFTNKEKIQEY